MIARSGLLALAASVLVVAGCSKPARPAPRAHPLPVPPLVSTAEPGQPGGRFTIINVPGLKTFNPMSAPEEVTRLLFGSLVNLNWVTQEPGPGLAESWSVGPDGRTWVFKLRHGLYWSDGAPLTAQDVAFTWNRVMNNPSYNRLTFDLFQINGKEFTVTNEDDLTVRVVTPEIYAPLLEFFGGVPILPRHILQAAAREGRFPAAYGLTVPPDKIVGSGPFRVREVRPGKEVLLERNPEYWVADRQGRRLPYISEVLIRTANPPSDAQSFLNGEVDAFDNIRPEQFQQFKQASAGGRFQLLDLPLSPERDFIWFNQNTGTNKVGKPVVNPVKLKWFRERKFRQAVSCAVDRERLVREVYGGRAQPAYSFISVENPKWNNPNVARFGFDPARARGLLAEIGMQDRNGDGVLEDAEGNRVEFTFHSNRGNPLREKASLMIQQDLKQLGIQVQYVPTDFRALLEKVNFTFDYECALMGLGGGSVDPASQLNVLKSSEELHQWFPFQKTPSTEWEARVDALMEAQMRTLDYAKRKAAFDEVQSILAEELPMIYTVSPFSCAAIRSDIGNVRPSVLTVYRVTWNLEELFFKPK